MIEREEQIGQITVEQQITQPVLAETLLQPGVEQPIPQISTDVKRSVTVAVNKHIGARGSMLTPQTMDSLLEAIARPGGVETFIKLQGNKNA